MNKSFIIIVLLLFVQAGNAQKRISREQVMAALRTHQVDSVTVNNIDTVPCSSKTSQIELEIKKDSSSYDKSYKVINEKEGLELIIYKDQTILYHSTFDYKDITYEKVKDFINLNIRNIEIQKDEISDKRNAIVRLYNGSNMYRSFETYDGLTNATPELHSLIDCILKQIPEIDSLLTTYAESSLHADSLSNDSIVINPTPHKIQFKSNGGIFKKISIKSNINEWYIKEYPKWIIISKNSDGIVVESTKNTKGKRKGNIIISYKNYATKIEVEQNGKWTLF